MFWTQIRQGGCEGWGEDESPRPAPRAVTLCFDVPHGDRVPSQCSVALSMDSAPRGFNIGLVCSRYECKEPLFKIPYFNMVMCSGGRGSSSGQPWISWRIVPV